MPRRVGDFELEEMLSRSQSSTLYRGIRVAGAGPEQVALKVLSPRLSRDALHRERFLNEARLGLIVDHPSLVRVLDHGQHRGEPFLVMELLEGVSLAEVMRRCSPTRTLPLGYWVYAIACAAEGLEAIHQLKAPDGSALGLVHRDVSPGNLFITTAGQVKVLDLGLARPAGPTSPRSLEAPSGTWAYLAPERLVPGAWVDGRADLFALAVILYEATTLRRLFRGDDELETLELVRRHLVRPPHWFVDDFPRRLEGTLLHALRRDALERPETAAAFGAALQGFLDSCQEGPFTASGLKEAVEEVLLGA